MGRKRGEFYVNPDDLKNELIQYSETNVMSEELGLMVQTIARKFTNHWKFVRYPPQFKEDMATQAIIRIIEQIDKIDVNHPKSNPFSYLTRMCYHIYIAECTKYYKYKNFKEDLTDLYFNELESSEGVTFNKNEEEDYNL